ncbi:P-loop containing nucleoside triphosphate hydrolase protein [Mycena leptocephala]|nr:P-loop containing nucleoside triphosphate hydrolase protein [Mycena leptocephala]
MATLDPSQWNAIALNSQAIPIGATLHSFQVQIANLVLMRHADAVLISSTGSGKSLTWTLPLLARKEGISLVITPFTSLGLDGELSNNCDGVSSLFIYHEQNTQKDFELAAQGDMLVVYLYRDSLIIYAGLKPDYTLVNLGNFRPELSIIILPMKHSVESFLDIAFILPLGSSVSNLVRTIIYCDDLELLTKMFWWAFQRVSSMDLPTHVIDIIHSGLSTRHQELSLEDFRNGKTSILLGSSKISAGMNFSGVRRVIQYKCRDLTVPDADQRRGRGARGKDETAVLMILLSLACREYQWIEVDPSPSTQTKQIKTTVTQRETALSKLLEWRLQHWRSNWRVKWPSYGPKTLVSDSDLETLANRPTKIFSVEEMRKYTHIVHWSELSEPLFEAIQNIYHDLNMFQVVEELAVSDEPQPKRRRVSKKPEELSRGEMVIEF